MRRRQDKRIWLAVLGTFVLVFGITFLAQKMNNKDADAASTAGFNAGYILSDYQMTNYNSMSEAQIQAFLKSKNACNDTSIWRTGNNVGYYAEAAPYSWHVAGGHYVCLADENINGESAAHIIWQAAQDYKINPQVLIVLLQKEQGLITDTLPNSVQYRSATGYGCPDTAACSSKYYGFKNQVRNAASLFRIVMDGNSSLYPVGNNYIQYSPTAACGGSVVNIQNRATSALYRYTPYQPNAAALAAGYGTATCGAYGNRNFYLYFSDWFGSPMDEGYPDVAKINTSVNKVANPGTDAGVKYRTHLEHYGWMGWTNGAKAAGSVGYGIRMEALQLKLAEGTGIEYRAHVEEIGWTNYAKDGALAGTTGESKRVEAVQIRLTGEMAKRYDIYYRVQVQDKGWMDWVKNDAVAGTTGQSLRLETLQVRLVKKDLGLGPDYQAHVQYNGWMKWVDGVKSLAGTTGQSLRVEALKIELPSELVGSGDILYRAHVQYNGWMNWVKNGELAGTTGQSLRVEALQIKLSDALAAKYDVYYRAHVQNIGWTKWVKNGETAGTTGQSLRVEALQVELVAK